MKWIAAIFILAILGILGYFLVFSNNCQLPQKFSVGNLDGRFKISQNEVVKTVQGAANSWNNQTGENLFLYENSVPLKINLVYDYRQQEIDRIYEEISRLSEGRQTIENLSQNYQKEILAYQKDLADYNAKVAFWNAQGGAPALEYESLENQRKILQKRRQNLIGIAEILNFKAQTYNEDLADLSSAIEQRKNLIITQGQYLPQANVINIYTFGNKEELKLVLMHELGHALGIDHAQNPQSLMAEVLANQDLQNPRLTDEDINLLKQTCNLKQESIFEKIWRHPAFKFSFNNNIF